MRFKRFLAVLVARNREFIRDRSALAWNIMFPLMIVFGFSFAFSGPPLDKYKIAVYGNETDVATSHFEFLKMQYTKYIVADNFDEAIVKVKRHQLDMFIDVAARKYWVNESSPNGYVLERMMKSYADFDLDKATVSGQQIRYVEWLMPGVLAMNMMFSALFGVGYVIVRYRKNHVLKRLKATPVHAFEFLSAQIVSRLWLIMAVTMFVYLGTDVFIDFSMNGNYFDLFIVFMLGAFCLISLGLLVAARITSEEMAMGMLNMMSWPMMFFSGVWFSLEGTHPLVQQLSLIFPLTHICESVRAIMIDGDSLLAVSDHLLVLALMSVIFLGLGSYFFRWDN